MQIIETEFYSNKSKNNVLKSKEILAPRGIIYDRNLVALVDNKPLYNVSIVSSQIDSNFNYSLLYDFLNIDSTYLDSIFNKSKRQVAGHLKPQLIKEYISDTLKIKMEEYKLDLQGLYFSEIPSRIYLSDCKLSHVLGYLGKVDKEDLNLKIKYNNQDMIGKIGIEKEYEHRLRGDKGKMYYLADSRGIIKDTIKTENSKSAIAGENIILTIDYKLQAELERLFNEGSLNGQYDLGEFYIDHKNGEYDFGEYFVDYKNGEYDSGESFNDINNNNQWDINEEFIDGNGRYDLGEKYIDGNGKYDEGEFFHDQLKGSGIIMNPKTGEVLSMLSYPDYDINLYKGKISNDDHLQLANDTIFTPLFNRSLSGEYPPGSIFKLVLAAIALEKNIIDSFDSVLCMGAFEDGKVKKECWMNKYGGHGNMNINDAISQSCNMYFYDLYADLFNDVNYAGPNNFLDEWNKEIFKFGFNQQVTMDLQTVSDGFIPSYQYFKNNRMHNSLGEYLNLTIGQGSIRVTPFQVIQFINLVANNGDTYSPHFDKNNKDKNKIYSDYRPRVWEIIQKAMYDAVNSIDGTAKKIKIPSSLGIVYGKTGTAQNSQGNPHSWFVGYMELKNGELFSLCILVENGGSGSGKATDIAKNIFNFIAKGNDV